MKGFYVRFLCYIYMEGVSMLCNGRFLCYVWKFIRDTIIRLSHALVDESDHEI